ncbi:Lrp/AsnC ligand binding domain-containing protein [Acetobacter sp. TBRC 12305]|uniref:Lrp/AsnC ligand binding domain-containing protein n=1 Tax=Acetobacter garciniae TaxID=2817435 RepID=A0A939HMV5_9PROT|nr:Lrp/AsnC ligand binding domain-containing protein [Acetobacter garciniae]MBO1325086.1 Lrp/AsnC ligand binding domain-containing protein [Acetobacter garciniae]MBX0344943.1 Lrp/AsnC ligand binding domain-containing protein [Acetobacter garciniae]
MSSHVTPLPSFKPRCLFVMIKCQLGKAYSVAEFIVDNIPQCREIYSISGDYDVMVQCFLDPSQDPGLFVTQTLQSVKGIADTKTILAFNAFTPREHPA